MNATALLAARADPSSRLAALPRPPAGPEEAYAIQQAVMAELGPIGGWKAGYNPASQTFTCAPIPAAAIFTSPAFIAQDACPDRGVEAEIALRLAEDLRPRAYTRAELEAAIASAHPAIELLQSRYLEVNRVDPLSNLADSASNHGLVYGPAIPEWRGIDFAQETVRVLVDGVEKKRATGNPAGPMLPLFAWLAQHGAAWAGGLKAGQLVTTGSWTGKDFLHAGAEVCMSFDHCGSVKASYT